MTAIINISHMMKFLYLTTFYLTTIKAAAVAASIESNTNDAPKTCWREMYYRGVGEPLKCNYGEVYEIGLCFKQACPPGYITAVTDCHPIQMFVPRVTSPSGFQPCPPNSKENGFMCQYPVIHRQAKAPYTCGAKSFENGTCYDKCNGGFDGVGPTCQKSCPSIAPFACGAICAQDKDDCAKQTAFLIAKGVAKSILTGTTLSTNVAKFFEQAGLPKCA